MRVATTVATATFSPRLRHLSTSSTISFMLRASARSRRGLTEAPRPATRGRRGSGRRIGSAARMPPVRGSYSACPLSGFTQTTANACRASRAIWVPTSSVSPRSQPSERSTRTAPRVSPRRPHSSLYALSESPMRVPPDQSWTRAAAASNAASGCLAPSSGVTVSAGCRTRTSRHPVPSRAPHAGRAAAPVRTPPSNRIRRGSARAFVERRPAAQCALDRVASGRE